MLKILQITEKIILGITIFLLPTLYLPFFPNNFETIKLIILVAFFVLLSLIKIAKILITRNFSFTLNKYDLILVIISISFAISAFVASENKTEAFFIPGNASFLLLAIGFYFVTNQLKEKDKNGIVYVYILSAITVSITSILSLLKVVAFLPLTTYGNLITSALFILSSLPFLVEKIFNQKETLNKIVASIASLIIITAFSLTVYQIISNKTGSLSGLPLKISWQIAADSIKESPVLGVGPSNYIDAFNKYRPIAFNTLKEWNLKYIYSANLFLTILTEGGILTIVFFLMLYYQIFKGINLLEPSNVSMLIAFAGILFFPVTYSFLPMAFILLSKTNTNSKKIDTHFESYLPLFVICLPLIFVTLALIYISYRATLAEFYFAKAINESRKSTVNAVNIYQYTSIAVNTNPYSDRYHLLLADTSYSIADNISKKENISDQDKDLVTKLIQQTINEAKASVANNPKRSGNWQSLAQIYSMIMPFAKGSEVFAEEAYQQAIFLDPLNPILRVSLGGVYYAQKKIDPAIDTFKLAVLAKNDYPNAHYNLSFAYKEKGDLVKAKEEINIVLGLVGSESKDYEVALKELEKIEELTKPEEIPN